MFFTLFNVHHLISSHFQEMTIQEFVYLLNKASAHPPIVLRCKDIHILCWLFITTFTLSLSFIVIIIGGKLNVIHQPKFYLFFIHFLYLPLKSSLGIILLKHINYHSRNVHYYFISFFYFFLKSFFFYSLFFVF